MFYNSIASKPPSKLSPDQSTTIVTIHIKSRFITEDWFAVHLLRRVALLRPAWRRRWPRLIWTVGVLEWKTNLMNSVLDGLRRNSQQVVARRSFCNVRAVTYHCLLTESTNTHTYDGWLVTRGRPLLDKTGVLDSFLKPCEDSVDHTPKVSSNIILWSSSL